MRHQDTQSAAACGASAEGLHGAKRFKVSFRIPRTPHSCGRYYTKRLTIRRRISRQTVWFQSDSRFAPKG